MGASFPHADWESAVRDCAYRLRVEPENPAIWAQYGLLLRTGGRLDRAEIALRRAIDEDLAGAGEYHRHLAHLLHAQGRTEEAKAVSLSALEANPDLPVSAEELNALGWSEKQLEELRRSRTRQQPTKRHRRRRRRSLVLLGDRARDAADWERAAEFYKKALDRNPRNAPIWIQYGHALKESSRLAEAETAYRMSLAYQPAAADAHLQLGHTLKLQNKKADAEVDYLRAFVLDPSLSNVLNELAGLGWSEPQLSELKRQASKDDADAARPEELDPNWAKRLRNSAGDDVVWLSDDLREYLAERFDAATVHFIREMMAVIDRNEAEASFVGSGDFEDLVQRVRAAAAESDPNRSIDVTIILPVFNGLVFTLTALLSVLQAPSRYQFEILVGDDASTDGTGAALAAIGGRVIHVRQDSNRGFIGNCNATAATARGRFLVFLNSDTLVLPHWLDELIGTFETRNDIGMVGAKLLNGDGTLQEAGGIYWQDGSAWNFGRGGDPRAPEYNYVKDADYCSGSSLAIKRDSWEELGGFDELFHPAYCEDADLAFRIRAAGKRVVYQPFAELIHHEGKSMGRDTSTGLKSYQVVNQQKLRERWAGALVDHFRPGEDVFLARDRSRHKPHILFCDHYIPTWDQDAGSRMTFHYLKLLVESGCQITFWPENLAYSAVYGKRLQQMGIEIIHSGTYADKFGDWVRKNGPWLDFVFLARPHIAIQYIDEVRAHTKAPVAYVGHDLLSRHLRTRQKLDDKPDPALAAEVERFHDLEVKLWSRSDIVYYPSAEECEIVRATVPGARPTVLPVMIVEPEAIERTRHRLATPPRLDPHHLLFVGGFRHPPNADAVKWFVTDVFEPLCQRNSNFRLTVVGSETPAEIWALARDNITVTGAISDDDLARFYRSGCSAIVPLRFGGGVKGKVIEAFANGTPVFSTSIGMQGIDNSEAIAAIADDAETFATKLLESVHNVDAMIDRACRALAFVEEHYSREAALSSLAAGVPFLRRTSP